jgi:hypothetical protein
MITVFGRTYTWTYLEAMKHAHINSMVHHYEKEGHEHFISVVVHATLCNKILQGRNEIREFDFWFILALFGGVLAFVSIGRLLTRDIWESNLGDFFALLISVVVNTIVGTAAANLDFIATNGSSVTIFTYTGMWYLAFPYMAMALVSGGFSFVALVSFFKQRHLSRGY